MLWSQRKDDKLRVERLQDEPIYIHIDKWLAIARSGGDGPDSDARTDSPEYTEADMGSNPHVTCMTVVVENSKFVFDSNICNGVLNRSPR